MRICEITDRLRSGQRDARRLDDEREYRAGFRPYLRCETEREVPNPIFIAGMFGVRNLKAVPLPATTWTVPEGERDEIVKAAIHAHYRRKEGRVAAFGEIVGYNLVLKPGNGVDLALPYDIHGNRAGPIRTVPRLGEATLSVDGQELSRSIWGRYGSDQD